MQLIIEGRALSRVPGPVGVVEDVVPQMQGKIIVGLRFLVNQPVGGIVLPKSIAKWRGLLRWYPLGGGYFPAEGLKPGVEEILYDFEHEIEGTHVIFRGDAYGVLNEQMVSNLEYRVRELELYCQAFADRLQVVRDNILRIIRDASEVEDEQLKPLFKRLEEIHRLSGSSIASGDKRLKRKLEELEKKMDKDKRVEEEPAEEYMGIIDRALQRIRGD